MSQWRKESCEKPWPGAGPRAVFSWDSKEPRAVGKKDTR